MRVKEQPMPTTGATALHVRLSITIAHEDIERA